MEKLKLIRAKMKFEGLDACLIPITDPHIGEYVPGHWRIIRWLSSFTGSAANIVITNSFAGLWTDSRYFIQAEEQLKSSGFELIKLNISHSPEFIDWIAEELPSGSVLGYYSEVVSLGLARQLKEKLDPAGIVTKELGDLSIDIWKDRDQLPETKIFEHPLKYAGESREEKIDKIRELMTEKAVNYHLLTALDDIAWTFNIRAGDISYSPVAISFALISDTKSWLFTEKSRLTSDLLKNLESAGIIILPYRELYEYFEKFTGNDRVLVSPATLNLQLYNSILGNCRIVEDSSIPAGLKAVKSGTEIENIKNAMLKDGLALTNFFYWLENEPASTGLSEMSITEKLEEFRSDQEHYYGASFGTIAAYNKHGAIVHYQATPETNSMIDKDGLLLLDSGGQYLDGTTDITRTVCLGKPARQQKEDFTLVLKGTIALAGAVFPEGTKGFQLDILARKALWERGFDYGHGTGHGVGYFLNVHEGPQGISPNSAGPGGLVLQAGMLMSDEPGLYRKGKYGIRTENLVLVKEVMETDFGKFLGFETLSLCYLDTNLIEISLLDKNEIEWIDNYHQEVFEALSPFLDEEVKKWLWEKTKELINK